jgi:hypothetical protein
MSLVATHVTLDTTTLTRPLPTSHVGLQGTGVVERLQHVYRQVHIDIEHDRNREVEMSKYESTQSEHSTWVTKITLRDKQLKGTEITTKAKNETTEHNPS